MLSLYRKMGSEGHENFQETRKAGWVSIKARSGQGQCTASGALALTLQNIDFAVESTISLLNLYMLPVGHSLDF